MNYEIRIEGADEPNGTIDLQRLSLLADSMRRIAEGALQLRLRGVSIIKGRKKNAMENALNIQLSGLREGSTCLDLSALPFSETLEPLQLDAFRQESQRDLPQLTPVSLFMGAFQEALKDEPNEMLLDKPLLRELKRVKGVLRTDREKVTFSNEGTVESFTIDQQTFKRIRILEEDIPDPKSVIVNGFVEMLHYSKLKVVVKTEDGPVDAFLSQNVDADLMASYWGKKVTITGTAHYKPGGRSVIEIERVLTPDAGDSFFSKRPRSETFEQQLERQKREGKKANPLMDIVGKWPGEESEAEFEQMMKELD